MARLKNPRLWFWTILVVAAMVASRLYAPAPLPHIQLPAEAIPGWRIGPLAVTNTIVALIVTDVLLLALGWSATRKLDMVPHGLQNLVEAVIEFWEDLSIQMVGAELTKVWLPLALNLFFIIWIANWSELVPGYDTVGKAVAPPAAHAEAAGGAAGAEPALFRVDARLGPVQALGCRIEDCDAADGQTVEAREFVPFLRVASSDLSFTIAMALIAFTAIQIAGLKSLGGGYVQKFFNFREGLLGVFVGLLEFISELSRIISFAFRLFGNLFAGQVLIFVLIFLLPFLGVIPVFGLELFVGMIQAFVFAILTLAFISVAIMAHDSH